MRISELSRVTGVATATIHFYIREGLLPPGAATKSNQADYDDGHVRRLRLLRALIQVGRVPVAAIKQIIPAIDAGEGDAHEQLRVITRALGRPPEEVVPGDAAEVDALVTRLGWNVADDSPARAELAATLTALRGFNPNAGGDAFADHAELAESIARREITAIADAPGEDVLTWSVIGTVVYGAALDALRRMALEHHSAQILRDRPPSR